MERRMGSEVPISWILSMFGWFKAAIVRASCSERRSRSSSFVSASGSTLINQHNRRWEYGRRG